MHSTSEVARRLDFLIKTDIQGMRDEYFAWLLILTGVVALGIILEGPEVVHEARLAISGRNEAKRRWITILALLGWILVAVGVAGEGASEALVAKADGLLQNFNDILLSVAMSDASNARERAANVEASNKRFALDLEKEKQKTARFQKEADAARLALSNQVKEQGPRWRLLRAAKQELVNVLSAFSGQRVDIYISGPQILADEETMSTWGALAEALGTDGAKWKLEHGGLTFADRDRRVVGIHVWVSTKAVARTAQAAKTLAGELVKILPPFSDRTLLPQDPDWIAMTESRGFALDKDAPYVLAARNPDLITIMIGPHPQ
ncbi:MAG TPA: hypothetical protein VNX18_03775 [Bryobacteraceae bacterium]|nr:hypothetical protein [Bryobacteraceae bacterium]